MPRVLAAISLIYAVLALAVLTGCPQDDAANMAQQLAGGGGQAGTSQAPPAGGADGAAAGGAAGTATPGGSLGSTGGTTATPPAGGAGTKDGSPAPAGDKTGKDKPAEVPYNGPAVEVSDMKITPPSYQFTGAGRYEISVNVVSKEPVKPGVWLIKAFDAAKKKVGSMELYIVMPAKEPRRIVLANFYCQSLPAAVVFELTDKKAQEAPAGGVQAPPGGGAGGGGSSGGGQGGGSAVPGGAAGTGGSGSSGGGGGTGGSGGAGGDGEE